VTGKGKKQKRHVPPSADKAPATVRRDEFERVLGKLAGFPPQKPTPKQER
jgi:hypothetical protein